MTQVIKEQSGSVKTFKAPKPIFYSNWFTKTPIGTIPIMVEGGGRYDSDPATKGWQEDSFWVGGYYGPREEVDLTKINAAFAAYYPGAYYCIDIEHWKVDTRFSSDQEVEDAIRKFRIFFMTAKKARPDMRFGVYSVGPNSDYWTPTGYYIGLDAWERYKKEGIANFTDYDRWCLSHVASNKTDYNVFVWDETTDAQKAFKAWQDANTRLTYGKRNSGKQMASWGLLDVVDYTAVSLYDPYKGDDPTDYIRGNIAEAKRIAPTKPCYPFVYPCYTGELAGQIIPIDEWRTHVRKVLEQADGLIIWGATDAHAQHVWVAQDEAERAISKRTGDVPYYQLNL